MTLERLEDQSFPRREPRHRQSPGFRRPGAGAGADGGGGHRRGTRRCIRCTPISCAAATSIRPSSTKSIVRATANTSPRAAWSPFSTAQQIFNLSASFQSVRAASIISCPCPMCRRRRTLADLDDHCSRISAAACRGGCAGSWSASGPSSFVPVKPPDSCARSSGAAAQEHLVPRGRPAARRRGAASLPAGLCVRFPFARHGADAARLIRCPRQARHGEHRSRDVVSPQRAGR